MDNSSVFVPRDDLGLLAAIGYSAPKPEAKEVAGPPMPTQQERDNADAAEFVRRANEKEPGRYELVPEAGLAKWQEEWKATEGSKSVVGDVRRAVGRGLLGLVNTPFEIASALGSEWAERQAKPVRDHIENSRKEDTLATQFAAQRLEKTGGRIAAAQEASGAKGLSGWAKTVFDNPLEAVRDIGEVAGSVLSEPRLLATMAAESAPSMLGIGLFGRASAALAGGAAAARTAGVVAGSSALSAGSIAEAVNEDVARMPVETLRKLAPGIENLEEARAAVRQKAFATWETLGAAALSGSLDGIGPGVEKLIAGGFHASGGLFKSAIKSAAAEAGQEFAQSGLETAGTGMAQDTYQPEKNNYGGMIRDMTSGALVGAAMGAGAGAIAGTRGDASPSSGTGDHPPAPPPNVSGQAAPPAPAPVVPPSPAMEPAPPEPPKGPLARAVEYGATMQAERAAAAPPAATGLPGTGENVAVTMEGGVSFPARIEGYQDGEALVSDPSTGEILQVPLAAISQLDPRQYGQQIANAAEAAAEVPAPQAQPPVETRSTLPPPGETMAAGESPAGMPDAGKRAIIDAGSGERFAGAVQGYVMDPATGKEEALVRRDDGTEAQVPAETLKASSLTPAQVKEQALAENPPVPRAKPTGSRVRSFAKRFVEMPDDLHARLYDLGRLRADQIRMLGKSKLDLDSASPGEQAALAAEFGIGERELGQLADDYRYYAEKAALDATSDLPVKMRKIRAKRLDRMRALSARTAAKAALASGESATDARARDAATSPTNDLPQPTPAQKEAGNYKKGHISVGGLDISIENPAGSKRSGTDKGGKAWSVEMKSHYGYIKGTVGKDKDHIDVFVKPGTESVGEDARVYVIDQVAQDGARRFDEHKVMIGFDSEAAARKAYAENYTKGWNGLGQISETTLGNVKQWLATGDTKKPFAKGAQHTEEKPEPVKWFGARDRAQAYVDKKKLGATHVIVEAGQGRFEVRPKASIAENAPAQPEGVGKAPPPGPFGPRLTNFRGNAAGAIAALKKMQTGEAIAALHHPQVGDIDLVYGREGSEAKNFEDGYGISKIAKKHPGVLDDLQGFVENLGVKSRSANRIILEDEERRALVRLEWNGQQKTWLLSAYDKNDVPAAAGGRTGVTNRAEPTPPVGQVADTSGSIAGNPAKDNVTAFERNVPATTTDTGKLSHGGDTARSVDVQAERTPQNAENSNKTEPQPWAAQFAGNKLFTADKVEAARARLRAKLTQFNSGVDPEVLIDGMTIAGAYIESGVRSFADYAKRMAEDFGPKIKPFLLSFWEGARHFPGLDTAGMTSVEESKALHAALLSDADAPGSGAKSRLAVDNEAQKPQSSAEVADDAKSDAGRAAQGDEGQGAQGIPRDESGRQPGSLPRLDREQRDGLAEPGEGRTRGRGEEPGEPALRGDASGTASQPEHGDHDARGSRASRRDPGHRGAGGRDLAHEEDQKPDLRADRDDAPDGGGQAGLGRRAEPPARAGEGAGERADTAAAKNLSAVGANHRIAPGALKREGSWRETAERNLRIVELTGQIEQAGRFPTAEEAALLTRFTGWGASEIANGVFPDRAGRFKPGWENIGARLKAALSDAEYAQAKRTTQYAHYTGEDVIRPIYTALQRMGFAGGRVLEPGMGVGLFNGLMPSGMAANSRYTGVEYDTLTGRIAKLLYPQSDVIIGDYAATALPKDYFDLAIGNPPFSPTVVANDPEYKRFGFMLHDYFFAKTIDRVKPGGFLVFVTSKGTMDKANDRARRYLAARADLVAAVRLPQTAFKENAGTEVVTDILFLRKRAPGMESNGVAWKGTAEVSTPQGPAQVNEYFAAHPEMVLGNHAMIGSMYRANEYTVVPKPGASIEAELEKALATLPEGIYKPGATNPAAAQAAAIERDFNPRIRKEGALYVSDSGELMQVEDGAGKPLISRVGSEDKIIPLKDKDVAFLKDWVGLRDALKAAHKDQLSDGDWPTSLKALRAAYDAFVAKHGPLRSYSEVTREDGKGKTNASKRFKYDTLLRLDVEGVLAYALEKIDTASGKILTDKVLSERVLSRPQEPEIHTVNDALFVSLNANGRLDMDHVAKLAGMTRQEAISTLGSEIFEAPDGEWQTADKYLSGDVRAKLRDAEAAAKLDKRFARNVKALLNAQPRPLGPADITINLGQVWIKPAYIEAYAKEVMGETFRIRYAEKVGAWEVLSSGRGYGEFNTTKVSAGEILLAILNNRQIKVTQRDKDGTTFVDAAETEAANNIAVKMRDGFRTWVWTDKARAEDLVAYYNEHFNNIAPRKFDGSHLTLPGVSLRVTLHPHQKRAIWRAIQDGDTYLAHAVGAGKTFSMIASAMEERRLGLSKKPMFVVPNHMLAQFGREFLQLYPAANVMLADEANFHTANRRRFVVQAALNNPDAIIITHSAFGRIGMSEEYARRFIERQIAEWRDALEDTDKADRFTRKQIERRIEQLERRLEAKTGDAAKKDAAITFEEIGVDRLFIDEAHEFRKLDFATNQSAIKGIDSNGSQRALDLFMKVSYLREKKPGRALVMASGTPITNTMGELFTVQRFFQRDQLEADGHAHFDAWANQYGAVVAGFEQNAAGGYEIVSRFAKFMNVPELMRRVRSFMDILTNSDLGSIVKRPSVETGGRQVIVTETPDGYREYQKNLQQRITKIRQTKGRPKKDADIILNVISDGRFSAFDMRFVDPSLPSDPKSKLNQAIDAMIEAYRATADRQYFTDGEPDPLLGSSIILFSDIGLGEDAAEKRGFDMREWIERRFSAAGIPSDHVAFIRDYKTHERKERLFADMREGKKRIMIGGKDMETGVNVQKRLAWLGHLDAPWYPASVEQREGRIIRQGNQNEEVTIHAFATKGSYDSTMWGMNARKARFIEQALSGDDSVRSLEDVSEASAFEVAAALASGDERYLKLAGLKSDVERLERLAKAHHSDQRKLRSDRYALEQQNSHDEARVKELEAALGKRKAIRPGAFEGKVGGATLDSREAFSNALLKKFSDLAGKSFSGEQQIGEIGGFALTFSGEELIGKYRAAVHLGIPGRNEPILAYPFDADVAVAGIATRAANQVNGLERQLEETRSRLEQNRRRIAQVDQRIGAPFPEQADLNEKHAEYVALEAELAAESSAAQAAEQAEAAAATVEVDANPAVAAAEQGERKYSLAPPEPEQRPTRMENLARGKAALARLLASRDPSSEPQWHAMHRHGLGWISFLWEAGPRGELGIAHLIEGRSDQGKNASYGNARLTGKALTDFVKETIPSLIVDGKLGRWYQERGSIRRNLYSAKGTVVVQPDVVFDGARTRINFIATAFPGNGKEMPTTATKLSEVEAEKHIKEMLADAKGRGYRSYSEATQQRPSPDGTPTPRVGPSATLTGSDLGRAGSGEVGNVAETVQSGKNRDGTSLRAELASHRLSGLAAKLIDTGKVRIVERAPSDAPQGAQGWTEADGTITLVAGAIPEGKAMAVLLHEAFHAGARPLLGEAAWGKLMRGATPLYRQFQHGAGPARAIFDAARASVQAAGVTGPLAVEEFAAYAIEHVETAPRALRLWAIQVIGHVKAWLLRRFGVQAGAVTPGQLRAIAAAAMRSKAEPRAAAAAPQYSLEGRTRRLGIPSQAGDVFAFRNDSPMKRHPDYAGAKSGDARAAARLITELVKPNLLAQARERFGRDVVYLPVLAQEASGRNKIPDALAEFVAQQTGASTTQAVVQSNRAYHTGADAMERITNRAQFSGAVERGKRYVLVDDVTVMGSTLADLADHIRANGGDVVGTLTLVNASRSGVLSPQAEHVRDIERRFGHGTIENLLGVAPSALTGPEAAYLRNYRDVDALRDRIATSGRQRSERLLAKGFLGRIADAGTGQVSDKLSAGLDGDEPGRKHSLGDGRRRASARIGEFIRSIAKGDLNQQRIAAGETPEVMAALGMDGKYLTITPDVIWKAIDKHGLTPADIEAAIKDAYEPLMVFQHANGNLNSLGKRLDHRGRPLILAANLETVGPSKKLIVTDIRTIHGKDGTGFVNEWIAEGRLRYWDKSGVALWFPSTQANSGRMPHLRAVTRLLTPKSTVLQPSDVFKGGRKYSLGPLPSRDEAAAQIKGTLTDLTPAMLRAVPLNYFSELKRPSMTAVDDYLSIKRAMDVYRGKKHESADKIAQAWLSYIRLGFGRDGKAKSAELADLMHASTLAGIDPSAAPHSFGEDGPPEGYAALRSRFLALPPKGRALFEAVRDDYKAQSEEMDAAILANVRRAMEIAAEEAQRNYLKEVEGIERSQSLSDIEKADALNAAKKRRAQANQRSQWASKARLTRLRVAFESSRLSGPYFPLARFGRYFVTLKDMDGEVLSFQRFERAADMNAAVRDMQAFAAKEYPGARVEHGALDETNGRKNAMDPRLVAEIESILGGAAVDPAVMDAIWQRYLQTLPELSIRKRQIHRKGTAGFAGDALRVYASHMFHAAHQMARLKYGLELQEAVNKAAEQARASDDPVRGSTLVNEMHKRHGWVMEPKGSALAQHVTSTMFVWYLAMSPASAMVNLTQTVIVGLPVLGARLGGISNVAPALMRAAADFIAGKGDARKANLNADDRRAMEAFYDSGLIDRTRSHDLAGIGNTGAEYTQAAMIRSRVMAIASWMFHQAEVMNREVTALAAYRLARGAGEDHATAVNTAHDLTWKTHFDYSNSNRPRILQGDVAKVALVFQNFQINMWYRFFRDLHQSLKGETAQARREARYQIAGITGMLVLLGGVSSIFGFKALMMLAGLFFDDADDPRDFEEEFAANIKKLFGPDIGAMILKGAPGTLLNVDLASRVGMADFLFRTRDSNREGRDAGLEWIAALFGATGSAALNAFDGVNLIMDGKTARGLEVMAPKFVKDLMQAYRFYDEGLKNRKGSTVLERDKVTDWDIASKAIGFTSGRVSETYERNRTLNAMERRVLEERKHLVEAWATARMHDDDEARAKAMERIKAFNARPYAHGSIRISQDTLIQSVRLRRANDVKRQDGVLIENRALDRHLRGLMPERAFQ